MSRYPIDVIDVQWPTLEPLLSKKGQMVRPIKLEPRAVVNALLFMNRTGCQWHMLPAEFLG